MAKKMPGRLVALSASSVAVIYLTGLVSTQPAVDTLTVASAGSVTALVATPSPGLTSTAVNPTSTPVVVVGASASATPTVSPTTPTTSASPTTAASATATPSTGASASTYASGTYSGTGTSRFGNVNVSVTISNGKIANVQITGVTTKYPASRIASLPGQVVQNQTANVNAVTGATSSSQAFKQAVQQALAQALAANSTAAAG
jgi:uncharacterized protein with FMN-binding domain